MKVKRLLPLALVAGSVLTASSWAEEAAPPRKLLDIERHRLKKISQRMDLAPDVVSKIEAQLQKNDAVRKGHLEGLAQDLKALAQLEASDPAAKARLDSLDAHRIALRDNRRENFEALTSPFTNDQLVRFLAKRGRHHRHRLDPDSEKPRGPRGYRGKIASLLKRHVPTFLTKILKIDSNTVETLKTQFESQKADRKKLRQEWRALAKEGRSYLKEDKVEEEKARLLVAKGRKLHESTHSMVDAAIAKARSSLTEEQQADLIQKLYASLQKVAQFVGVFWDLEELRLFQ